MRLPFHCFPHILFGIAQLQALFYSFPEYDPSVAYPLVSRQTTSPNDNIEKCYERTNERCYIFWSYQVSSFVEQHEIRIITYKGKIQVMKNWMKRP